MSLITLHDVSLAFGGPLILDAVNLRIEPGERICLVGRNGEGKSTLLRVLTGAVTVDQGSISKKPHITIGLLPQEVPAGISGTVREVITQGLGRVAALLRRHQALSHRLQDHADPILLTELEQLQQELEHLDGWTVEQRVNTVLSRLQLAGDLAFSTLSGGMKRRVMLGQALVSNPDLLLLDEPTNHLDLATISWLEEFLLGLSGTLLFITHDRMLADRLATRIIDLDRGQLTSWPGNLARYQQRKEELLQVEQQQNTKFDQRLNAEEQWIRQGIKARRTRNQGRVRALLAMREEHRRRRSPAGRATMRLQEAEQSGRLVVKAEDIAFAYQGRSIIKDFSTTILRGDKVGIIGPNGCGKTTLLRLLLGELTPTNGTIRLGTNLAPVYFDQLRGQLDPTKSAADNVADGNDRVTINGRPQHIIGYLKNFLFTPDRARAPISRLSGGERNRLLLAKLFTKPANLLILDEPTNDLDIESLELLEELLVDTKATILLVSHDRTFLNNVVTSTIAFGPEGAIGEFAGGYDDWLSQRPAPPQEDLKAERNKGTARPVKKPPRQKKLTFKEKDELAALPGLIEELETEKKSLFDTLADPAFYQKQGAETGRLSHRLEEVERAITAAYQRWEELEEKENW